MNLKNSTKFVIKTLNQEKHLNQLCKIDTITQIKRLDKQNLSFKCSYVERKKVEKYLKENNIEVLSVKNEGTLPTIMKIATSYGMILAFLIFGIFYAIQSQFVVQYEVSGVENIGKTEIVDFVKNNFSTNKSSLDTEMVEQEICERFKNVSFASCVIRGQTLVINIKEKLMPDEKYGQFQPIIAQKDARITQIDLISGTVNVKVGQLVQAGDVLVEPYVLDASGDIKKVEAEATIYGEVYNEASVDHYNSMISVERSGRVCQKNEVKLFGLTIYTFEDECDFAMYEVEYQDVELIDNLVLPFKLHRSIIYELEEKLIESNFEQVKEEYIQKAKEKALEKCANCDTIKEEFYTIRELAGVTIVNYCIVTLEEIGGIHEN